MKIAAEYIDHMGDDLRVSNAARVSFAKWRERLMDENDPELRATGRSDSRLINDLAQQGHFTPFTHCIISMRGAGQEEARQRRAARKERKHPNSILLRSRICSRNV